MSQCVDFLVVAFFVTIAVLSPLIILIIFIALAVACYWTVPVLLFISILYGIWFWIDYGIEERGGHWSARVRSWSIWNSFARYFPIELVKTADLDPKRNYIFGYHPHGLLPMGVVGSFYTEATNFSQLFPGIRPHIMTLLFQFICPLTRELFLRLGSCLVSRKGCEYFLGSEHGSGHALIIVIGGVREQRLTRDGTMILYLKSRKGFIDLALKHGASLVPVISFGENELYPTRWCGFPWGRFLGYLPLRHPIVTVVGEPIDVDRVAEPSKEQIEELHETYIRSLEKLYEENKSKYGMDDVPLEII